MEASVEQMEAQLKLWSLQISDLTAKTQMVGARTKFDDLLHIDELMALYAIAQSMFDEFRVAGSADRARLEADLKKAWNELDAAFAAPKP
jgi:hypothetical protein